MRISQVMTRCVQVVPSTMPAWEAWEVMRRRQIHHLVVRDKGRILGVFSDADAGGRSGSNLRVGRTVGHLMTPHLIGAAPTDSVADVARRMQSLRLECLVVVSRGRLVGIVTSTDLLRILAERAPSVDAREPRTERHRVTGGR